MTMHRDAAGIDVSKHRPDGFDTALARRWTGSARAAGFLTKTDAVDARMLAAMSAPLRPRQGDLQAPGAQRADKPAGDGSIAGPLGDSTAGMASGRV